MKELVYKVALVLGALVLLTVCVVFAIHQELGLGGGVLTISGIVLVGMSIWRSIDISISLKKIGIELKQTEAKATEAATQATQ